MSIVPNHIERQFMQQLRGRGWVRVTNLPPAQRTIANLLQKRWIESRGAGKEVEYQITEQGMAAKTARIPVE